MTSSEVTRKLEEAGLPGLPKGHFYEIEYDPRGYVLDLIIKKAAYRGFGGQVLAHVKRYVKTSSLTSVETVVELGKEAYGDAFPDKDTDYHQFVGEFILEQKPNEKVVEKPDVSGMTVYITPPTEYIMVNVDGREIARSIRRNERGLQ